MFQKIKNYLIEKWGGCNPETYASLKKENERLAASRVIDLNAVIPPVLRTTAEPQTIRDVKEVPFMDEDMLINIKDAIVYDISEMLKKYNTITYTREDLSNGDVRITGQLRVLKENIE